MLNIWHCNLIFCLAALLRYLSFALALTVIVLVLKEVCYCQIHTLVITLLLESSRFCMEPTVGAELSC